MPEKKVHKKDGDNFEPTIVEVYGDDRPAKTAAVKRKDDEEIEQDWNGTLEKREEVVEMKSEPVPTALESETLKTEVVDEKPVREPVVMHENVVREPVVVARAKDEAAFDEEIGHQRKAVRSVFGVGLVVFLIIFGLTGWAFYLKSVWMPAETQSEVLVAQATPTPTATPTPSPSVVPLERSEMTLEILNGSGIVGLAGKVATTFKELGYEVPTVGNGDPVTATEVYVQEDLEDQLSMLLDDLASELKVSSIAGYLDEDETVTARIVLGE